MSMMTIFFLIKTINIMCITSILCIDVESKVLFFFDDARIKGLSGASKCFTLTFSPPC